MNCPRCYTPQEQRARFCRNCGLPIAPAASKDNITGNSSLLYQPISRGNASTFQKVLQTSQSQQQSVPQNSALLVMNANDAKLVSVYTREVNGNIPSFCLRVSGATEGESISFEVAVEAEAGNVLGSSGAPYLLSLVAFDITLGQNAYPGTTFNYSLIENYNNSTGLISQWPTYKSVFTVTLNQAQADAVVGHVLQYTISLISPPPGSGSPANAISFLRSEPFILV
jgi:hypothetical protein